MPPPNVLDKELYNKILLESKKVYKRNSVYSSGWVVREYKKRGGRYRGDKTAAKREGITRWMRERWVQVEPYLKKGEAIACGEGSRGKACRPLVRVNSRTPPTLPELLKIHSKSKLLELARKKNRNMDIRVDWRKGIVN